MPLDSTGRGAQLIPAPSRILGVVGIPASFMEELSEDEKQKILKKIKDAIDSFWIDYDLFLFFVSRNTLFLA